MKKRVIIAMSGGVDSSVAAALLKREGYECIGMYLNFWTDSCCDIDCKTLPTNKCCTLESLDDARRVAGELDIPFYVMDVEAKFRQTVVDYFLQEYASGRTPNPCIQCNKNIKFGELLKCAQELNADALATGHYAKVAKEKDGSYALYMARDKAKDQSYFLYHLNQEKLKHILLPMGNLMKTEVYKLARQFKLPRVFEKKESQGVCFFAEKTPENFLKKHLASHFFKSGSILTVNGKIIGEHKGLPLYTIGQRRGLYIGGLKDEKEDGGWYVVNIDIKKNQVIVGRKKDAFKKSFACDGMSFIDGKIPFGKIKIAARVRYRACVAPATLEIRDSEGFVKCNSPIFAVSPGQSVVFYDGEKVLGGGIIYNDES